MLTVSLLKKKLQKSEYSETPKTLWEYTQVKYSTKNTAAYNYVLSSQKQGFAKKKVCYQVHEEESV